MRQAGVIAAAGIVALEQMVEHLADDHLLARGLAAGLATFPQIAVDIDTVQTNIVVFRLRDQSWSPASFTSALREQDVLIGGFGDDRLRMVTHYGVDGDDIDITLAAVGRVLKPAA